MSKPVPEVYQDCVQCTHTTRDVTGQLFLNFGNSVFPGRSWQCRMPFLKICILHLPIVALFLSDIEKSL